jgi:hypothetical protein
VFLAVGEDRRVANPAASVDHPVKPVDGWCCSNRVPVVRAGHRCPAEPVDHLRFRHSLAKGQCRPVAAGHP